MLRVSSIFPPSRIKHRASKNRLIFDKKHSIYPKGRAPIGKPIPKIPNLQQGPFLPSVRTNSSHYVIPCLRDCLMLMLAFGRNAIQLPAFIYVPIRQLMLASGSTNNQQNSRNTHHAIRDTRYGRKSPDFRTKTLVKMNKFQFF